MWRTKGSILNPCIYSGKDCGDHGLIFLLSDTYYNRHDWVLNEIGYKSGGGVYNFRRSKRFCLIKFALDNLCLILLTYSLVLKMEIENTRL
jgi:hypothetical protein